MVLAVRELCPRARTSDIRAYADVVCCVCADSTWVVKSSYSLPLLYTCNAVIINVRILWHTSPRNAYSPSSNGMDHPRLLFSHHHLLLVAVQIVPHREALQARRVNPDIHRRTPAQTVKRAEAGLIDLDFHALSRVAEHIDPDLAGPADLHLLGRPLVVGSDAKHDSTARTVMRARAGPADAALGVEVVGLLAVGVHAAGEDEVGEETAVVGGQTGGRLAFFATSAVQVTPEHGWQALRAEQDEGVEDGLEADVDGSGGGLAWLSIVVGHEGEGVVRAFPYKRAAHNSPEIGIGRAGNNIL